MTLYPRRNLYIQKLPDQERWSQKKGVLRDYQILGVIEDGGRGLWRGCYWGEYTKHAVLDIDAGGQYHDQISLAGLKGLLVDIGLRAAAYQSSASKGWHVYIPFTEWVPSKEVEHTLKQYLKSQGYELKGGELEVFPTGNALRLPLQPGFAWLNEQGQVETRREEIERDEALRRFLTDLKTKEKNWSEAKFLIDTELARQRKAQEAKHKEAISTEGFEKLYDERGKIQEVWELGRDLWDTGLQEKGQRHDGVLAVGHYLWYGDPENSVPDYAGTKSDRVRAKLIEAWLEKKHNGKCRHINEGRWDVVREQIARATVWREKSEAVVREAYPLTERLLERLLEVYRKTGQLWTVERLEAANNEREREARERIREAVIWLLENDGTLTISDIARVAGASRNTVKKNIDLLCSRSGVYITWGVRGGLDAPEVSSVSDQLSSGENDPELKNSSSFNGASETGGYKRETEVAPLLSFLAQEPTTRSQCQNQDLEAGLVVLTPGPKLRDIQSGKAWVQGGGFICPPVGSLVSISAFRAGVDFEPRSERPGQSLDGPEIDKHVTSIAVTNRPLEVLERLRIPQKPERRGVLQKCSCCTRMLGKGLRVLHYNRARGPPQSC